MGPYESSAGDINQLLSLGKPVIHFDHRDTLAQWASQFVSRRKRAFFRCHLDEQAAIRLALETLVARGHSRIGVPWFSSTEADWVPQRIALLQEAARSIIPQPTLICIEQKEPFWQYLAEFDIRLFRREIDAAMNSAGAARPGAVSRREPLGVRLFDHTPSLNTLLRREKVTSIIALNDLMARKLYLWTRYADIAIPRELSVISFDNSFECRHFPVSTIDFGFSRLGYQAAHILIGDIPVRADRNGNIPGVPMLIDRGSVGAPGDRGVIGRILKA
jgi:DNA-binding LacI/PurR family transcriptional regulator